MEEELIDRPDQQDQNGNRKYFHKSRSCFFWAIGMVFGSNLIWFISPFFSLELIFQVIRFIPFILVFSTQIFSLAGAAYGIHSYSKKEEYSKYRLAYIAGNILIFVVFFNTFSRISLNVFFYFFG